MDSQWSLGFHYILWLVIMIFAYNVFWVSLVNSNWSNLKKKFQMYCCISLSSLLFCKQLKYSFYPHHLNKIDLSVIGNGLLIVRAQVNF